MRSLLFDGSVDFIRGAIEVAETFSDGEFGVPKTRSSNRVLPMSQLLRGLLEIHRVGINNRSTDDLVFSTPKGMPLNPKNLYNRVLAPACDRIKQPRVSWYSFRHTHATLLADVRESIKTAQSLLGHLDLGTTLNTYAHVILGFAAACRRAGRGSLVLRCSQVGRRAKRRKGQLTGFARLKKQLVGPQGFEPWTNGL